MDRLDEHFAQQEIAYYDELHRSEQIEEIAEELADKIDDLMGDLGVHAYCAEHDSLYEAIMERAEELWESENE